MTGRRNSRQHGVPPVSVLRPLAQGEKTEADRRLTYRVFRFVSIYLTWALLHTRVTANQVTVASIVIAGAGLVMVASRPPGMAMAGCLLLLGYHLLDRVDGEVARYREQHSLHGIYLDNAGHYLTGAGLLLAATYRLAPLSSEPQLIWLLGSLGAIATVLVRVEKHSSFHLFGQYVLAHPELLDTVPVRRGSLTRSATKSSRAKQEGTGGRGDRLAVVREAILTTTSFPTTTLALLLAFVSEVATGSVGASLVVLVLVATLQLGAYLGVEFANLTQNLASESHRLARLAGLSRDGSDG